jgi:hypothetical protein
MAQLSESLARDAIRRIRSNQLHCLTANEIDQALWAWLMLNGYEPRPTQETCHEKETVTAPEASLVKAIERSPRRVQETPPEPGMHRNQVIARARMAHGGKWPAELTSGVMFYEGMRVTREDFEHR